VSSRATSTSSGSGSSRIVAERRTAVLALTVAFFAAPAAHAALAQNPNAFELSRSVQQSLVRLEEGWSQWVAAGVQGDPERADETVRELLATAGEVGFSRLPDLAFGAAAQARAAADHGDWALAEDRLAAAERLASGEPEVRFAAARLHAAHGRWATATGDLVSGLRATWRSPERDRLTGSVLLWTLWVFELAAALFVVLLAWVHGPGILRWLRLRISPPVPNRLAAFGIVLLVLVPFTLPGGLFWGVLLWSALLWPWANAGERVVLLIGWLAVSLAPLAVARTQQDLLLSQSPPMRAFSSFERSRLYGSFFSDLEVMRTTLPKEPAAIELQADIHRTLGQWDLARAMYREVQWDEPENVPVLLNLGAFHFRKGEFALANAYFERATRSSTPSAAAWYNLMLGTSEAYLFDESRTALARAREIDSSAVDAWLATPNPDRVLTFNGGLRRRDDLRAALLAAWTESDREGTGSELRRVPLAALATLGAVLLAAILVASRRRWPDGGSRRRPPKPSLFGRWTRTLLPAIAAAEDGVGWIAGGNLLLVTAIALLPWATTMAGDPIVPSWPGDVLARWAAAIAATLYLGLRLRAGWRESRS